MRLILRGGICGMAHRSARGSSPIIHAIPGVPSLHFRADSATLGAYIMLHESSHRAWRRLAGEWLLAAVLGLLLLAFGTLQRAAVMGTLTGDWQGLANLM